MKPVGVRGRTAVMVLKQARSLRENTCCAASLAKTNYLGLARHGLQRLPRRKETCSDLARAREPGPGQPDRARRAFRRAGRRMLVPAARTHSQWRCVPWLEGV